MMNKMVLVASLLLVLGSSARTQELGPQRMVPIDVKPGRLMAEIDLGNEFPQMNGFVFRQTLSTVAPGTGKPWHSHAQDPEIACILSGTLTEVRENGAPTAHGPGSTLINDGKTQHMWANMGSEPVLLLLTSVRAEKH